MKKKTLLGLAGMLILASAAFGQVAAKLVETSPTQFDVVLAWTQSTSQNITQNCIYRSAVSGGPYSELACIAANTTYTDQAPLGGNDYYVVTAVNSQGIESAYSNQATVAIPVVNPPTGLSGQWGTTKPN